MKRVQVNKHSTNFREATSVVDAPIPEPKENEVVLQSHFLGINASDINWTAGKYPMKLPLPYGAGFESLAKVTKVGSNVQKYKVGDCAILTQPESFAEYVVANENVLMPVPSINPEFLPLAVSGLTASISLEHVGQLSTNETVLVTAAAGGTGQFAVQLAKLAGNHVIGTVGSDEKVEFLKSIGCDRVINYKKEDLGTVLKKEYPKGVNIVYESVGGDMFNACVDNMAIGGRLIIIGMVSSYAEGLGSKVDPSQVNIAYRLLQQSASLRGFFLPHFKQHYAAHVKKLVELYGSGKLKSSVEIKEKSIDRVVDAVEYLHGGKNQGKVLVQLVQ